MNMRGIYTLLFSVLGLFQAFAQDLHTPSEVADIMEKSIIYYSFKENPAIAKGKMLSILPDDYYFGRDEDGKKAFLRYNMADDAKILKKYEKAQALEQKGDYAKARRKYLQLEKDLPNNALIINRVGETYFYEQDYVEAIRWARKATRVNAIHYPAYVLLARVYTQSKNHTEAMKAITTAHILNRNSREIISLLKEIYYNNGFIYDDSWAYVTEYAVRKTSDSEVLVAYNGEPWRAYGACKALWMYEPYYLEKMAVGGKDTLLLMEHECLLNMAIAYENWGQTKLKKQFTMGVALQTAMEKKMIPEFILFEMRLAENPRMAFYLSDEEQRLLANYILQVKSLKVPKKTDLFDN